MRAIIQERYGAPNVLKVGEMKCPNPKDNEVLIELEYANVSSGDARLRALNESLLVKLMMKIIYGWNGLRKKIPGVSGAGIVKKIGANVTTFQEGDRVYSINGMKLGHYAEYVTIKETGAIAKIPDNISFKVAAPLSFGALTAYHFINKKNIMKNNNVLIYGASGSVGTYAVQLAKYYGAFVTAVSSAKNHQILKQIGADHTIDYNTIDFRTVDKQYDVIFDAVGFINKKSCSKVLTKKGLFLSVKSITSEKQTLLNEINEIVKTGNLKTVIDKEFSFDEIVQAHEYQDSKHKVGNIVLLIKTTGSEANHK
ncbi:MAG: NAD(P)-dependent alcohol dehydrogenase [Tenericutes bacterium]|jgi:NADPH:quinone reductase-like Zn-dependent oxidoreductase|nr:NAD(P)-dependent alcohol dehydrogenase [Mycoplasmatota bacterium]